MNHFNHDLHLVSYKIILYVISINGYVYIKPLKKTSSFEYATGSMFCASQAIMMEAKKLIK